MTVTSIKARESYNGDGTSVNFAVPFSFFQDANLVVYVNGALQALTTDYAVSGAGNPAGGTVSFAVPPPAGTRNVVIVRELDLKQEILYPSNDPFPAKTHETALDKLTMLVQRTRDLVGRAFTFADTDTSNASLTVPTPQGGYLIGWQADGKGLANFANTGGGSTLPVPVAFSQGGTGGAYADAAALRAGIGVAAAGAAAASGLTLASGRLLGRTTVGSGAVEEIAVAGALSLAAGVLTGTLPTLFYVGLQSSWASATTETVGAGKARDLADARDLALTSAITGTLTANAATNPWSAGNGGFKLVSGTRANSTWYHKHLCRKIADGSIDWFYSVDATSSAAPPSGYVYGRRVKGGQCRTDGSGNIVKTLARAPNGQVLDAPVKDVDVSNPGTAAVVRTLASVPSGIRLRLVGMESHFNATVNHYFLTSSLDQTDFAASAAIHTGYIYLSAGSLYLNVPLQVNTNTSAQIRTRQDASGGSDKLEIMTFGWFDDVEME